jgi:transcriptional regulator with XRE-family HTH domain/DNA-directed RNA polymerase subunit RPC12/RpoP
MDQKKTGAFIAQMRKEQGLTQAELADTLLISDRTVSKWETGKGLPEISLMLPLCEKLGITVNELLTGAKLSSVEYQKKAEVNIMDLMQERRSETRFRMIMEVLVLFLTLLAGTMFVVVAEYLATTLAWKIALNVIAVVIFVLGIAVCAMLEMRKAVFQCTKCKKRFIPSKGAYIMGIHTITTRHLKCPHCGVRNWCKRVLADSLIDETMDENQTE